MKGFARRALTWGACLWLAACASAPLGSIPAADDEALYASLYPYYAELCAVSQLKKKPGFGADVTSGIGGHSVLYLNGVCREADAHYPTIALCDPASPRQGVGLSVNAHYKNANWVATEGRNFFFHGTVGKNERLTREAYLKTQAAAEAMGVLDGVEFHDDVFEDQPAGMSKRDFMYDMSVATDYAIAFGRDRYCARVPLDREKMAKTVNYLNGLNDLYKDGKREFEWNVLQNNCSHVNHNALTAAGVWPEWKTDRFIVWAALDFPVPKNEFVNLMRRTNDMPLDDPGEIFSDSAAERSLFEDGYLPTAPGGLAEARPAIHDNDVYDTDLKIIFYDDPILGSYQRHFEAIFSEPRYSDIRANLSYFSSLYHRIEAERKPLARYLGEFPGSDREGFAAFYGRFYADIERESATVRRQLASLTATPVAGPR